MYNLSYFKETDKQVILQFVHDHPFAMIIGVDKNHLPVATQLPLFLEEEDGKYILKGHMMKNTDHHKAFMDNPNILAVFTGPHCYVSATWYEDPNQASTWNYISVHMKGMLTFLDEKALEDILRKTTLHFENNDPASSTVFDNLKKDYTNMMMKAIVAFKIEVTQTDNVFKLSQNKDATTYDNIISRLRSHNGDAALIAEEMVKRREQLFKS